MWGKDETKQRLKTEGAARRTASFSGSVSSGPQGSFTEWVVSVTSFRAVSGVWKLRRGRARGVYAAPSAHSGTITDGGTQSDTHGVIPEGTASPWTGDKPL